MKKAMTLIVLFVAFTAFSQTWNINFELAMAEAKASDKPLLLVFSGSDWCGPCIKLDKNVFASDLFKSEAAQHWIIVKADFPKKKANALPEAIKIQNDKLAEKYNRDGNFPFVLLLDANGKVLGRTGYKNETPAAYISELKSFEHSGS